MTALRMVVVGGGHLGRIHAKLASANDSFSVVGVVDPSSNARNVVEEQLKLSAYESIGSIIDEIDVAVVASPTVHHYEVTSQLLRAGIHCLVEKPLALTADESNRLVQIAKSHSRVLQVGHVERFNPCWTTAQEHLGKPKFIEAVRSGPYSGRSTDIGVVMDLMIHDLDLILSTDRSAVESVTASGIALLGSHEDIAEARILFESGCIANVKASRVASSATRHMQVYASNGYADIDFSSSEVKITKPSAEIFARSVALDELPQEQRMLAKQEITTKLLVTETLEAPARNAILDEQNDFAISVLTGCSPAVSGSDGARAVEVASMILDSIAEHRWDGAASRPWRIGATATTEPRILPLPIRHSEPMPQPADQKSRRAG